MGATQSADEQKATALAEENERLRLEVLRLKKFLLVKKTTLFIAVIMLILDRIVE